MHTFDLELMRFREESLALREEARLRTPEATWREPHARNSLTGDGEMPPLVERLLDDHGWRVSCDKQWKARSLVLTKDFLFLGLRDANVYTDRIPLVSLGLTPIFRLVLTR